VFVLLSFLSAFESRAPRFRRSLGCGTTTRSPLYGDLRDLPPALLVVGTLDFLLEDNLAMAARLSAAGGEVDVRVYPESVHGFTSFPTAMAAAATLGIESWLAKRLAGR
jgi:acetyl esterase/lipase